MLGGEGAARCECDARLAPSDAGRHRRRFHAPLPGSLWPCAHCHFRVFTDAMTHCLLAGHGLAANTALAASLSVAASQFQPPIKAPKPSKEKTFVEPSEAGSQDPARLRTSPEESPALELEDGEEEKVDLVVPEEEEEEPEGLGKASWELSSVVCAKCGLQLCFGRNNRSAKVVRHVLACIDLRPYGCTACSYNTTIKHNAVRHVEKCAAGKGAALRIADKAKAEEAASAGLDACFPGLGLAWRGL